MDWNALAKIGYAAVAAVFGYVATFVFKRHEVARETAVEVDEQLRGALDVAETALTRERASDVLDDMRHALQAARVRAISLPPRQRSRVAAQITVADEVVSRLYLQQTRPPMFQHYLQAAIAAAREEVTNLLLPSPLLYRRRLQPQSFPAPEAFEAIMTRYQPSDLAGLDEALEPYRRTTLSVAD